jgi:EAL domain-containing protein (putative c-di-GMP-specific phosphodiesterase class I)
VAVVSASIGMALSALGDGSDELMRNADVAMHVAKSRGHGHCVQYAAGMQTIASERLLLEADLREAVEREEFVVEYQPIVVLHTGEIVGAEALVRWVCRTRGVVSPGVFIPVAEETGLIVPIGRWVLQRACATAQEWTRVRGTPLRITVNVSARQLLDEHLVEDVRGALAESGLPASQLTLELTESSLMTDTALSLERLTSLKALGVSLAIDDFGTGYCSLAYLQRYPIDVLKIDKSFVDVLDQDDVGPVLAGVIVALGNTLQMHTVAEGIETELQRERVLALGCELGQGYLFSRPLAASAFDALLAARGSAAYAFTQPQKELSARAA